MPLISDADAIYRGGSPVDAVYAGDVLVWAAFTGIDIGPWSLVRTSPNSITAPNAHGIVHIHPDSSGSLTPRWLSFHTDQPRDADGRRWIDQTAADGRWIELTRTLDGVKWSAQIVDASLGPFDNLRIETSIETPNWNSQDVTIAVYEDQP